MSVAAFQQQTDCSFELGKAERLRRCFLDIVLAACTVIFLGKVGKILGGSCGIVTILADDRGGIELGELILQVDKEIASPAARNGK